MNAIRKHAIPMHEYDRGQLQIRARSTPQQQAHPGFRLPRLHVSSRWGLADTQWEATLLLLASLLLHAGLAQRASNSNLRDTLAVVAPPIVPPMIKVALLNNAAPAPASEPPAPAKPVTRPKPAPVKAKPAEKPKPKPLEPKPLEPKPLEQVQAQTAPAPATNAAAAVTDTQPRAYANYLHNHTPTYPDEALANGWEGRVLLKVEVLADGRPGSIELAKSSGKDILDKAALNAVRKWRFQPARHGSEPTVGWVTFPVDFKLQN